MLYLPPYFRRNNVRTYRCSHLPTCVQNPPILFSSQRMTLQVSWLGREDELGKKRKFLTAVIICQAFPLFPPPPEMSLITKLLKF